MNRLFGTMAFICVAASILMMVLIFKGRELRRYTLFPQTTEDGLMILQDSPEPMQKRTKDTDNV